MKLLNLSMILLFINSLFIGCSSEERAPNQSPPTHSLPEIEKKLQELPLSDSYVEISNATDEEIINKVLHAQAWLFKVLSLPENSFTAEEKEAIASHLSTVFSNDVIDHYMDILYREDDGEGRYVLHDLDILSLPDNWDEYTVTKKQQPDQIEVTIESKLHNPGMSVTHFWIIKEINGKQLFFEKFLTVQMD